MKFLSKTFITLFILVSCSLNEGKLVVPESALNEIIIKNLGGGRGVKCPGLQKWLNENGKKGSLAALIDKRNLNEFIDKSDMKSLPIENEQEEYLNQVRFIAYQLLKDKYNVESLNYNKSNDYNLQLLKALIKLIHGA